VLEPDDLYASPPPWDIGRPQPAFRALADAGEIQGRVLDTGCGTGEHVLMCAALGLDATGIDLAGNALDAARQKARDRGLSARFLHHDALRLSELGETFGTVLDCGLFHIFTDDQRAGYAASLRMALAPGCHYFMLCLSDRDPGTWGGRMRKVTPGEITATFADGWTVGSIEPATIDITTGPGDIQAWLAALTRI
jgi:cyclopropane fatty-acyl-phospholipid synthase-like methyltransferase